MKGLDDSSNVSHSTVKETAKTASIHQIHHIKASIAAKHLDYRRQELDHIVVGLVRIAQHFKGTNGRYSLKSPSYSLTQTSLIVVLCKTRPRDTIPAIPSQQPRTLPP